MSVKSAAAFALSERDTEGFEDREVDEWTNKQINEQIRGLLFQRQYAQWAGDAQWHLVIEIKTN